MKYSIIIPTYTNTQGLKVCIESILKHTTFEDKELIIISNGGDKGKLDYIIPRETSHLNDSKLIIEHTDEPLGYPKAINRGILRASGEFIILMNDDCQILDFAGVNEWVDILAKPFEKEKVGISCVHTLFCPEANDWFGLFFLVMLRKTMINEIGLLDEIFTPGSSEDIDFCLRAKKNGWIMEKVPNNSFETTETNFPIYHKGGDTVWGVSGWEDNYRKNLSIIKSRTQQFKYTKIADVTIYVSTTGRYETTLPLCLTAIANQTLIPKYLIIYQDDKYEMKTSPIYQHIFALFKEKGIITKRIQGKGVGQVMNHQKALKDSTTEWIWRLDDDQVPEPNVLEKLCEHISDSVGAIGCSIIDPGQSEFYNKTPAGYSINIEDIRSKPNLQWSKNKGIHKVDHLHGSFLFRKSTGAQYNLNLSKAGHREETLFSYSMRLKGWDLIVDTNITIWHFRAPKGGIRDIDKSFFEHDERIFEEVLRSQENKLFPVFLDSGLGDHWAFKEVLIEMLEKTDKMICVAACYPEVFENLLKTFTNLKIVSIATGNMLFGEKISSDLNLYAWCDRNKWDRSIIEAYRKIYLTDEKN